MLRPRRVSHQRSGLGIATGLLRQDVTCLSPTPLKDRLRPAQFSMSDNPLKSAGKEFDSAAAGFADP